MIDAFVACRYGISSLDFVFIDHAKEKCAHKIALSWFIRFQLRRYLSDFQIIEKAGLIKKGTVVFADNCIYPGCPDYLKWIRCRKTIAFALKFDPDFRCARQMQSE